MISAIEDAAAKARAHADAVAAGLTDFREQPAYKRIAFPKPPLEGVTETRANALLDGVVALFDQLAAVYEKLASADAALDAASGLFSSDQKLREADGLLKDATPILNSMSADLASAWRSLREIDDAWLALATKLADAAKDASNLREYAHNDANKLSQLDRLRERVDALRVAADADPLGVGAGLDEAMAPLAAMRGALTAAVKARRDADDAIAAARQLYGQLAEAAREAAAAAAQAKERVEEAAEGFDPAPIASLGEWLDILEAKLNEGLVKPVLIGVEHWNAKARTCLSSAQSCSQANMSLILTRRELRGRLLALKAKAVAKGVPEDPKLAELASQATQILYSKPTPLNRASALVADYEKHLNGR